MRVFGLSITRDQQKNIPSGFVSVERSRGWWPLVREGFTGAWQRGVVTSREDILTYAAVYACVTLIAKDIAKLRIKLMEQDATGIWTETENAAFSPVLRKPNHFQTRIDFLEQWITSKLIHGNTYVLKERDSSKIVRGLYVLDPQRVQAVVAPDGAVYYRLSTDNLSGLEQSVTVPASEIIHDVNCPLYHPLCGVSPLTACGLAATQGLRVQQQSSNFFENGGTPSGVLTGPEPIDGDQAKDLQDRWEREFSGNNFGKVAVLGFGFKYEPMTMTAVDAQLIEQLKWTAENVCTAHHVPPYMIGVGPPPTYNNIEALNQQYYSQCLQNPIEKIELLLDEGIGMARPGQRQQYGAELDLDELLRMDTATRVKAAAEFIGSGAGAPNEARRRYFGLPPVKGGDTPYMQQQNYSLAALARRDSSDPFASSQSSPRAAAASPAVPDDSKGVLLQFGAQLSKLSSRLAIKNATKVMSEPVAVSHG